MANEHCRKLSVPLRNEWHLSTIKATMCQFKAALEESAERQLLLTGLSQTLWGILQKDFDELVGPSGKKTKSSSDEIELLGLLQASLRSLIIDTRSYLTTLQPKDKEKIQGRVENALHVLEEHDGQTASRTRAEGLAFQAYMDRGYQLEAEALAGQRDLEGAAAPHDLKRNARASTDLESDVRDRLQVWEKALRLCNAALKRQKPDDEETQCYEPDDMDDLSQDFSVLTLQEQELTVPTTPMEATRVLSGFRPSQNTPVTLQTILAAKADPNIIVGAGGITPLHSVIAFARKAHVRDMRRLLLKAGAQESDVMKERWELRRHADAVDDAWVANFHQEPTSLPSVSSQSQ